MTLNKLQQKADLWLTLHGATTFLEVEKLSGKKLMCENCCKYYQQCPYWKYYNNANVPRIEIKHPIIEYKGACIKWLDDEGFKDLTNK
jgi:hypothetical protein